MTDKKKINIQIFNWGPCVVRMKINDPFKKLLLDEAKKNKQDYTDKLAGILDKETGYSEESKNKIIPHLSQCIGIYDQAYEQYTNKKYDKTKNDAKRADEKIKLCNHCKLCWEYDHNATKSSHNRTKKRTIYSYYKDFPTYGKEIKTCPKCIKKLKTKEN